MNCSFGLYGYRVYIPFDSTSFWGLQNLIKYCYKGTKTKHEAYTKKKHSFHSLSFSPPMPCLPKKLPASLSSPTSLTNAASSLFLPLFNPLPLLNTAPHINFMSRMFYWIFSNNWILNTKDRPIAFVFNYIHNYIYTSNLLDMNFIDFKIILLSV